MKAVHRQGGNAEALQVTTKGEVYISFDAAASTSGTADYTAISVVLESQGKFFVLRAEHGRWDYEQLMERALYLYKLMKPSCHCQ